MREFIRFDHVSFWGSNEVQQLSTDMKLVYLYLITAPNRDRSGIQILTPDQVLANTGVTLGQPLGKGLEPLQGGCGVVSQPLPDGVRWLVWPLKAPKHEMRSPNDARGVVNDILKWTRYDALGPLLPDFLEMYQDQIEELCPEKIEPLRKARATLGQGSGNPSSRAKTETEREREREREIRTTPPQSPPGGIVAKSGDSATPGSQGGGQESDSEKTDLESRDWERAVKLSKAISGHDDGRISSNGHGDDPPDSWAHSMRKLRQHGAPGEQIPAPEPESLIDDVLDAYCDLLDRKEYSEFIDEKWPQAWSAKSWRKKWEKMQRMQVRLEDSGEAGAGEVYVEDPETKRGCWVEEDREDEFTSQGWEVKRRR